MISNDLKCEAIASVMGIFQEMSVRPSVSCLKMFCRCSTSLKMSNVTYPYDTIDFFLLLGNYD